MNVGYIGLRVRSARNNAYRGRGTRPQISSFMSESEICGSLSVVFCLGEKTLRVSWTRFALVLNPPLFSQRARGVGRDRPGHTPLRQRHAPNMVRGFARFYLSPSSK